MEDACHYVVLFEEVSYAFHAFSVAYEDEAFLCAECAEQFAKCLQFVFFGRMDYVEADAFVAFVVEEVESGIVVASYEVGYVVGVCGREEDALLQVG